MAANDPQRRALAARKAAATRHHPGRDVTEIDREIKFLGIKEHVQEAVDTEPLLTTEQRQHIAAILTGGAE